MANLVELVKQAALEAVAAAHPTQAVFGKVTDTEPLAVRIHQKLRLTAEFLALSETVRTKLAAKSLRPGDTLLLLQQQGGQRFLALDVLPGADWTPPAAAPVTWADVTGKPEAFPPAPHAHTAAEVGAAPAAHTHTPAEIGAAPKAHAHTAAEIGAAPASHTHTAAETGAAPAAHTHAAADIAAGTLPLARGGTGAASAAAARTNLGITYGNLGTVPVANGGTGATSAAAARSNLGISYGNLGTVPVANGGTGATSAAAARSNLGITYGNLGTVPIANGGTGATTAQGARTALSMSGTPMYSLWNGTDNLTNQLTLSGLGANPGYNTFIFVFQEGTSNYKITYVMPYSYLGSSKNTVYSVGDAGTGSVKRFYAWKDSSNVYLLGHSYTGSGGSLRAVYGRY